MYICVDFDGTIVDHSFPAIGKPNVGALAWIRTWQDLGAKIILFTMRSDGQHHGNVLSEAVNYLERHDIRLFGINHNPTQISWTTSPKAYGEIFVDDAAFGCPLVHPIGFNRPCADWSVIGPAIEEKLIARADILNSMKRG